MTLILALILILLALVIGVVLGAYSHKWRAKETGAPANLSLSTAEAAASALLAHGKGAALAAIDTAAEAAKQPVLKA